MQVKRKYTTWDGWRQLASKWRPKGAQWLGAVRAAVFVLVVLGVVGCSSPAKPKPPIPVPQMADMLQDLHLLEAGLLSQQSTPAQRDSLAKRLYPTLLKQHNLTKEEFMAAYDFYAQHPALLVQVYDTLIRRGEVLQQAYPPVSMSPQQQGQ